MASVAVAVLAKVNAAAARDTVIELFFSMVEDLVTVGVTEPAASASKG